MDIFWRKHGGPFFVPESVEYFIDVYHLIDSLCVCFFGGGGGFCFDIDMGTADYLASTFLKWFKMYPSELKLHLYFFDLFL